MRERLPEQKGCPSNISTGETGDMKLARRKGGRVGDIFLECWPGRPGRIGSTTGKAFCREQDDYETPYSEPGLLPHAKYCHSRQGKRGPGGGEMKRDAESSSPAALDHPGSFTKSES